MWEVSWLVFEKFKLDGGAMFGIIPKPIWNKLMPADSENRIQLVTRALLLKQKDKLVLIDCGCGSKWDEKKRSIYAIEPQTNLLDMSKVTDVLLTHLHFDHGGGISIIRNQNLEPTFPNAKIYVSEENLKTALKPNLREKGSYLPENVNLVAETGETFGGLEVEIFEGVHGYVTFGHTKGMTWFRVKGPDKWYFFPSDLMPTSNHIKIHYNLGYDICVEKLLEEKQFLLEQILRFKGAVVFCHDPSVEVMSWELLKDQM
jgi:glyoxylase-like metal-dependent hydrolase (beta-lactamase superfamily II)